LTQVNISHGLFWRYHSLFAFLTCRVIKEYRCNAGFMRLKRAACKHTAFVARDTIDGRNVLLCCRVSRTTKS
jgi:hypothetical protein